MYIHDYRVWTGEKMFYFTLGDAIDRVIDAPNYSSEEMLSSDIGDNNGEIAYVGDVVEINDGEIMQVKFGHFEAYIENERYEFVGFYVENDEATTYFSREDDGHFKILGNIYENPKLKDLLVTQ